LTGKNPRPVPWFVDWMVFCEMGGRWLLAIATLGCVFNYSVGCYGLKFSIRGFSQQHQFE